MISLVVIGVIIRLIFLNSHWRSNEDLSACNSIKEEKEEAIKAADCSYTLARKKHWWYNLDEQWRTVFRFQVYSKVDYNGEDIADYIFNTDAIDINLKGITNLRGLKHLTHLKGLCITNYEAKDLSDLRYLDNLIALQISHCDLSKTVPIAFFKKVQLLSFNCCQITDLESFIHLRDLTILNLSKNNIHDIRLVKKLQHIQSLNLSDNPIMDFSALSNLEKTKVELSFNQKYNLQKLQEKNIQVIINFNSNLDIYEKTYYENN